MRDNLFKTEKYIMENGTALQKTCCQYVTGKCHKDKIATELAQYQNPDGGFSNGLDIEYMGPVSSPFTTATALGHIVKFGLQDTDVCNRIMQYLKNTQNDDGSWEDSEEMNKFPHPPYMGPGVYPEYKTGMIIKWLVRLGSEEKQIIEKARNYMVEHFDKISANNDFWSAVAYSSAFSVLPEGPEYAKIMNWSMSILMPQSDYMGWQQISGMIEDDIPIDESIRQQVMDAIKKNQEDDGAWPHAFGVYNRVWSALFIMKFILSL
jgi:hypothetical protein